MPRLGQRKKGLIKRWPFKRGSIYMKFSMIGQEKGGLLIQVTTFFIYSIWEFDSYFSIIICIKVIITRVSTEKLENKYLVSHSNAIIWQWLFRLKICAILTFLFYVFIVEILIFSPFNNCLTNDIYCDFILHIFGHLTTYFVFIIQ